MTGRRLYRSENGVIGGVCAGIAEYLGIDVSVVRIIFLVLFFLSFGAPVTVYIVLWLVLPNRPTDYTAYVDVTPESAQSASSNTYRPSHDAYPNATVNFPGVPDPRAPEPGSDSAEKKGKASRALTIAGVVLVIIGVGIIVARIMGTASWWSCWPLFIIAWGVAVMMATPKEGKNLAVTMIDGAVIVMVGAILLFCNLGQLSWGVIACIALQWPVLVIAAGVSVVAVALKSPPMHIAAGLIAIAALLLGMVNFQFNGNMLLGQLPESDRNAAMVTGALAPNDYTVIADLENKDTSALEVNVGGANLSLKSDDGSEVVLYTNGIARRGSKIKVSDDLDLIKMDVGGISRPSASVLVLPQSVTWDEIDIEGGASKLDLDLTGIKVRDLDLEVGASTAMVTLGAAASGGSRAELEAGASHLMLVVPADVNASISITNAGEIHIGDGFSTRSASGRFVAVVDAPGSGSQWDVEIDGGVATIDLVRDEAA